MRLLPGRKLHASLRPVNQGSFVTPIEQASHSRPVGFRTHECFHGALRRPTRSGPERTPAIPQQHDREVAVGLRSLPGNSRRLKKECGEIPPGPNAKTRNGDEGHQFLLSPESPACGLRIEVSGVHPVARLLLLAAGRINPLAVDALPAVFTKLIDRVLALLTGIRQL
jgi:hypothetical protein